MANRTMKFLLIVVLATLFTCAASRVLRGPGHHDDIRLDNVPFKFTPKWLEHTTGDDTPPPDDEDPDDAVWRKAKCRGAKLLKAMTLDEEESSRMLQWPYTQSPWDGDLKNELRLWGYRDDPEIHEQSDAYCDFDNWHQSKRAFEAMGVDWRSAGQGGPNHCFFLQHKDGPAVILNEEQMLPDEADQRYEVDGKAYKITGAYSRIGINRKDGIVYFLHRKSPEYAAADLWGLSLEDVNKEELPRLRASSDLAWGLWNRVPGNSANNINMFIVLGVVNEESAMVIIPRALESAGVMSGEAQPWPGTDIIVGNEEQEEAAFALIGSPNGLGAGYFLLQHKRQLGHAKFIWKIKIFKGDDPFESEDPNIIFYVDTNSPPMTPDLKPESSRNLESNSVSSLEVANWTNAWTVSLRHTEGNVVREHLIFAKV